MPDTLCHILYTPYGIYHIKILYIYAIYRNGKDPSGSVALKKDLLETPRGGAADPRELNTP